MVAENLLIAEVSFNNRDRALAQQLLRHKERLGEYERELRDKEFARLRNHAVADFENSSIYLDILTHLKRINSHVTYVAYAILKETPARRRRSPAASHSDGAASADNGSTQNVTTVPPPVQSEPPDVQPKTEAI